MVTYTDNFDRANGPLGSIPSGPAWQVLQGSWEILSNRAYSPSTENTHAIAVAQFNAANIDITLSVAYGGGDAVIFRATDANNYWRAKVYYNKTTTTNYTTEYEWKQVYQHGIGTHFANWGSAGTSARSSLLKWGSSSSAPSFPLPGPDDYHWHQTYSYNGGVNWDDPQGNEYHTHSMDRYYGSPTKTGNTRTVSSGTSTSYTRRLYLEKVEGGVITWSSYGSTSNISTIRVVADGNNISAYANGILEVSRTDSFNATATLHGIGKTYSPDNSHNIDNFSLTTFNQAPLSPTVNYPKGNTTIDRTATQRFDWDHNDPDASDDQTQYELRYRVAGTTTWTTVSEITSNSYRDFPADHFPADDFEWQVRTADEEGVWGPWSGSAFFTTAIPPTGLAIIDPTGGQTITGDSYFVQWTADLQTRYEIRTVADDNGTPDPTTIYYFDYNPSTSKAHWVPFEEHGRIEHVQVRIENDGIWSSWDSVQVSVQWEPPATPALNIFSNEDDGYIVLEITNPEPNAEQPPVVYNDVYRRIVGENSWSHRDTNVEPNTPWSDFFTIVGVQYEYRVIARADNGTSSSSLLITHTLQSIDWWLRDPLDPQNSVLIEVEQDSLPMNRPKDIAFFNPLGRSGSVAVEDVQRSRTMSLTIGTLGEDQYDAVNRLVRLNRTLFLHSPLYKQGGYVRIDSPIKEEILNPIDPWVHFTIEFVEVDEPVDVEL